MLAAVVAVVVGGAFAVLFVPTSTAGSPATAAQVTPDQPVPLTGDFDADGRDDVLWYGAGAEADHLWYGGSQRAFTGHSVTIGGAYWPLVGDFDGSGTSDVLCYAPGAASDYLWLGSSARTFVGRSVTFGDTSSPT